MSINIHVEFAKLTALTQSLLITIKTGRLSILASTINTFKDYESLRSASLMESQTQRSRLPGDQAIRKHLGLTLHQLISKSAVNCRYISISLFIAHKLAKVGY